MLGPHVKGLLNSCTGGVGNTHLPTLKSALLLRMPFVVLSVTPVCPLLVSVEPCGHWSRCLRPTGSPSFTASMYASPFLFNFKALCIHLLSPRRTTLHLPAVHLGPGQLCHHHRGDPAGQGAWSHLPRAAQSRRLLHREVLRGSGESLWHSGWLSF